MWCAGKVVVIFGTFPLPLCIETLVFLLVENGSIPCFVPFFHLQYFIVHFTVSPIRRAVLSSFIRLHVHKVLVSKVGCLKDRVYTEKIQVNLVSRSLVDEAEDEIWPNPICIT